MKKGGTNMRLMQIVSCMICIFVHTPETVYEVPPPEQRVHCGSSPGLNWSGSTSVAPRRIPHPLQQSSSTYDSAACYHTCFIPDPNPNPKTSGIAIWYHI